MKLPRGKILKVLKSLCGMPESPMHWYKTYVEHQKTRLGMQKTFLDPCFMYKRDGNTLDGILGLQVDDTLYAGATEFARLEKKSKAFPRKGSTMIRNERVHFKGMDFSTADGHITIVHDLEHET